MGTYLISDYLNYLGYSLIFLGVIGIIYHLYRNQRRYKKGWLSLEINEEIKNLDRKIKKNKNNKRLTFSNKQSYEYLIQFNEFYKAISRMLIKYRIVFYVVLGLILESVLVKIEFFLKLASTEKSVIASIYGSFAVIILTMMISAIESGKSESKYNYDIVIKTFQTPIISTIALLAFTLLWSGYNMLILIFFGCAIAIESVRTFVVFRKIITSPNYKEKNLSNHIKEISEPAIIESIRQRIGNNILSKRIENLGINYRWLSRKSRESYYFIEGNDYGKLIDVNLESLKDFTDWVNNIYKNEKLAEKQDNSSITISENKKDFIFLLKLYGQDLPEKSIISKDNRFIIALANDFPYKKEAQDKIKYIFKFDNKNESASKKLELFLDDTKSSLIKSIEKQNSVEVDSLIRVYLNFVELFLEKLHEFGANYSSDLAIKERTNIFDSWQELKNIDFDLQEILDLASESKNQNILSSVLYLPIAIATRSIAAKDHLLFQQFINFIIRIYYLSQNCNPKFKDFILDRSWRCLQEVCKYHLEPEIENCKSEEDVNFISGYIFYTIKIFQDLLKHTTENKKEFELIFNNLKDIFSGVDYSHNSELNKKIKELNKTIKQDKNLIIFAIGSFLFKKENYQINENNNLIRLIKDFLPKDITDLFNILIDVHKVEKGGFYGWNLWEVIPDGEARFIDTIGKFNKFFCYLALDLIIEKTSQQEINIPSEFSNQSIFNDLIKTIDASSDSEQKEKLKILIDNAKSQSISNERQFLASINLYDGEEKEEVEKFKEKVKERFYESSILRNLLIKNNSYENKVNKKDTNLDSFGYHQIYEKYLFIKNWHVHCSGFDKSLAEGMSNSEEKMVADKIANLIPPKKSTSHNLKSEILDFLKRIDNPLIIWSIDYDLKNRCFGDEFINSYQLDFREKFKNPKGLQGAIKNKDNLVPVINIYQSQATNRIIIIDMKDSIKWTQYSPIRDSDNSKDLFDIFKFSILDLNIENKIRQKILYQNPDWLKNETDKGLYLKTKALIDFYQKFEIKIINKTKIVCIDVIE